MDEQRMQTQENVFAGIVGAFLFSLAGGVLWYLLYQVGFLAGISGAVGVFAAVRGYSFFAKGQSIKGVVISIVIAVLVLVIAWYLCLATDVYNAHREWYETGMLDYRLSYFDAVKYSYTYLSDMEILKAYLRDLGVGLALCAVASFSSVKTYFKNAKQAAPEEVKE